MTIKQTKRDFKISLKFTDQNIQDIKKIFEDKAVSKIKVRIEATHSGFVNANNFFYTPVGMNSGIPSFTEPFGKPICIDHNTSIDPIGRIYDANYVDYKQYDSAPGVKAIKSKTAIELVDTIKSFIKSDAYRQPGYKGLGHAEIYAEINDKEAMQKVIDKRYLTVSVSGGVDSAICSICGVDKFTDSCDHLRGEVYDGEKAFLIGGNMNFKETSYVNVPADPNTDTNIIQDSEYEFMDGTIEIVDYIVQSGEQQNMKKKKLQEVLSNSKQILADTLKALGFDKYSLQDSEYDALRKPLFLFANDKALPIHDKAHILAAFKVLEEVEDSEEKSQALTVLNRKFEKEFGKEVTIEDAISSLVEEEKKEEGAGTETTEEATKVEDLVTMLVEKATPLICDAIVLKLKESVKISDSYTADRVEALETEVDILIRENGQLTDKYKEIVINQILAAEGKVDDKEYKDRLAKRSLQSLSDKLEDLGLSNTSTSSQEQGDEGKGEEGIKDADLNPKDASTDIVDKKEEQEEENNSNANQEEKPLTSKEVKDKYQELFKTKGISAANRYIKDLKESKKLPENFTF